MLFRFFSENFSLPLLLVIISQNVFQTSNSEFIVPRGKLYVESFVTQCRLPSGIYINISEKNEIFVSFLLHKRNKYMLVLTCYN